MSQVWLLQRESSCGVLSDEMAGPSVMCLGPYQVQTHWHCCTQMTRSQYLQLTA
jgi:hypothetical protein